MSIAFSNTPLSSMNSRVTPLEMSSPAIVSMAVQCLRMEDQNKWVIIGKTWVSVVAFSGILYKESWT